MANPGLPGTPYGPIQTGYGTALIGLALGATPTVLTSAGSGVLTLNAKTIAGTAQSAKISNGANTLHSGALGVPLELHFRFMDGTTQVAGAYATSLDGVSDLATIKHRVAATGYTVIMCTDLFVQNGTIYFGCDTDPGSDGVLDYFIVYGKAN